MGVAASQMERKGIQTEKGNINRQITADNKLLKELKARITRIYNWSKEQAQAEQPQDSGSLVARLYEAQAGRRNTQQRNVEELARSIAAVGLMNPITVTQDNTLIAGLHRLEAVKLLGWTGSS